MIDDLPSWIDDDPWPPIDDTSTAEEPHHDPPAKAPPADPPKTDRIEIQEAMRLALEQTMRRAAGQEPAIATGVWSLDQRLGGGFEPGQLVVLGARTSTGKTAVSLQLAMYFASVGHPVIYWTGEMPALVLARRIIAAASGVDLALLRRPSSPAALTGQMHKLEIAYQTAAGLPLSIMDQRKTVEEIAANCPAPIDGLCPIVFIDHLGLLPEPKDARTREQAVSATSRACKMLALERNAVVVLAAQLNRESESRQGRPRISNLRESGAIEQDADVVILLHRAANSDPAADPILVEALIAKQRDGEAGTIVKLRFDGARQRVEDWHA